MNEGQAPDPALDASVQRLLERVATPAAQTPVDLAAIGAALVEVVADHDYVFRWAVSPIRPATSWRSVSATGRLAWPRSTESLTNNWGLGRAARA